MKIKLASEIDGEPKYGLGWEEKDGGRANPKFGSVRHVVVCDDSGEALFDQIEIREQPGSIIVPYFLNDCCGYSFGVVEQIRPIIENPETGEQGSVVSVGFPMGFAVEGESLEETVKRELTEETQAVMIGVEYLGSINPLTSLYAEQKANEVFAVKVDGDKVGKIEKENLSEDAKKEGILSSDYVSQRELFNLIKSGKVFCGLSLAALVKFMAPRPALFKAFM